jgi:hypothetical protein
MALAVLLLGLLLTTCTFLTSDIFPYWLSFAEASVDLRTIGTDLGLGPDPFPEALEYAPFVFSGTDYSKVLVYLRGSTGQQRLLLLDPGNLALKEDLFDADFSPILASAAGGFLCGERTIDPISYSIGLAQDATWDAYYVVRPFRDGIAPAGRNYVVAQNDPQVAYFASFGTIWDLLSADTPDFDPLFGSYQLLDADYAQGYSILGRRLFDSYGYAASYSSDTDFMTSLTVFDSAGAIMTGPFPVADDRAWLTAGGPVALDRSQKETRLVRYQFGTGSFATGAMATELDSISFDEDDIKVLSFDPSGKWWFIYDRFSGKLYKLRTWWK